MKKFFAVFMAALFLISQNPVSAFSQQGASEVFQPGADIALTADEKKYLEGVFKDTWNYMSVFVDPATGIPYDSDKKQPATSLSNVGLYLGATAIAAETGLIGKDEAITRINMALTSLDKVPHWKGFPRVWLSARGLKPIQGTEMFSYSKHVSNLIGGLGLVKAVFPAELGTAVDAEFQGMDFGSMYDAKTGWVKGGFDVPHNNYATSQPFGPWYYKFLASEARLISFYLVAKGFAPPSHWKSLTRPIQKQGDKWFFVSSYEDGGAYMPYMASLYIDERNTEMGLSQKNLSASQMEQAAKVGAPVWGLSASLDTKGEYVPYGQLTDEVVSPYASMLAMLHYPKEGTQNLKKLEELGVRRADVYHDRRTNFTAFTKEGDVAKPWAILEDGEVFFLNKSGMIEKLSSYVDWSNRYNEIKNYDHEAMQKLLEKSGKTFIAHETTETFITQVFGPSSMKPGLKEALSDPAQWNELIGLASAAGLYFSGWIQFTDGQKAQAAFSEINGVFKPLALSVNQDVLVLSSNGEVTSLKTSIEAVNTLNKMKAISPETCVQFAPVLGIDATKQSQKADCAEHVLPAYTLKEAVLQELGASSENAPADVIAMAIANAEFLPAQIKLNLEIPGNFGFRDAVNWKINKVEKHYLTPSQGMGFLALANVLHDHVVWNAFAKDPDVAKGMEIITPTSDEMNNITASAENYFCSARGEYKVT